MPSPLGENALGTTGSLSTVTCTCELSTQPSAEVTFSVYTKLFWGDTRGCGVWASLSMLSAGSQLNPMLFPLPLPSSTPASPCSIYGAVPASAVGCGYTRRVWAEVA